MADAQLSNPHRLIVRDLVVDATAVAAGTIGIGALLVGARGLGLVLLGALLAGVVLRLVRPWLAATNRAGATLGTALVPRALLIAGTAVAYASSLGGPGPGAAAGLAAALLVAVVVTGPLLRRAAVHQVRFVAHLPGVPADVPARDLGTPAVAANVGVTALGLLLAAVGVSAWWWVGLAVLAFLAAGVLALDGRRKILGSRAQRTTVPAAVAAYEPEFVVYTSRPDDASYQITM